MKRIILVVLALTLMANGTALAVEKNGGLAASFVQPTGDWYKIFDQSTGDFNELVGSGFGLSAIFVANETSEKFSKPSKWASVCRRLNISSIMSELSHWPAWGPSWDALVEKAL